jgi:putative endopeptidase
MMVDRINEMGASPIKKYVAEVEAIETYEQLWTVVSKFQFWDVPAFFDWWVGADNLEPDLMNLYFGNGGLILPDYTYYTVDSEEMRSHRAAYREFIVTQLRLAGLSDEEAQDDADTTLEIETELAVYQRLEPWVSLKESFAHLSQEELAAKAPNVDFKLLFEKMGIPDIGTKRKNLVLKAPAFFARLSDFFEKRSAKSLVPYLRWHLVYNLSPLLSQVLPTLLHRK